MDKHALPDVPPTSGVEENLGTNPHHIFTQMEARILNVLADGQQHEFAEMMECLANSMATTQNLQDHVYRIRKKIRPYGGEIVCVKNSNRRFCYQRVKLFCKSLTSNEANLDNK